MNKLYVLSALAALASAANYQLAWGTAPSTKACGSTFAAASLKGKPSYTYKWTGPALTMATGTGSAAAASIYGCY
jgi:hypothetical protein